MIDMINSYENEPKTDSVYHACLNLIEQIESLIDESWLVHEVPKFPTKPIQPIPGKRLARWNDNYAQFVSLKNSGIDINNLMRDEPLYEWAYRQKTQYNQDKLSDDKIKLLEEIGFVLGFPDDGSAGTGGNNQGALIQSSQHDIAGENPFQTLIGTLGLSARTFNCLKRANISTVGEVLEMSDSDLLKIRNFGEKSFHELQDKLTELGVDYNQSINLGSDKRPPSYPIAEGFRVRSDQQSNTIESSSLPDALKEVFINANFSHLDDIYNLCDRQLLSIPKFDVPKLMLFKNIQRETDDKESKQENEFQLDKNDTNENSLYSSNLAKYFLTQIKTNNLFNGLKAFITGNIHNKQTLSFFDKTGHTVLFRRLSLEQTLEEIGSDYDRTRERIRQIEAKALKIIKRPQIQEGLLYLNCLLKILITKQLTAEGLSSPIPQLTIADVCSKLNIAATDLKFSFELQSKIMPEESVPKIWDTPMSLMTLDMNNNVLIDEHDQLTLFKWPDSLKGYKVESIDNEITSLLSKQLIWKQEQLIDYLAKNLNIPYLNSAEEIQSIITLFELKNLIKRIPHTAYDSYKHGIWVTNQKITKGEIELVSCLLYGSTDTQNPGMDLTIPEIFQYRKTHFGWNKSERSLQAALERLNLYWVRTQRDSYGLLDCGAIPYIAEESTQQNQPLDNITASLRTLITSVLVDSEKSLGKDDLILALRERLHPKVVLAASVETTANQHLAPIVRFDDNTQTYIIDRDLYYKNLNYVGNKAAAQRKVLEEAKGQPLTLNEISLKLSEIEYPEYRVNLLSSLNQQVKHGSVGKTDDDKYYFIRHSRNSNVITASWRKNYTQLVSLKNSGIDINNLATSEPLYKWAYNQKTRHKLSDDKIKLFENIGFVLAPNKSINLVSGKRPPTYKRYKRWNDKYAQFVSLKDSGIDINNLTPNEPLYQWAYRQKTQYNQDKLSDDKIKLLEEIGFVWEDSKSYDTRWIQSYEYLLALHNTGQDVNLKFNAKNETGFKIGRWCDRQRHHFREGKLSEKRIHLLEEIGFKWSLL